MNSPILSVQQVRKSYGTHSILQDVSLAIPAGQTFALLGRNGAGKTTLIRILLGLIPADSGIVRINGLDPVKSPIAVRTQVGFLAEDQTMYGWMTPLELLAFLAPFYPRWDRALAQSYLKRFEIPEKTRIENLSKGLTVKLGLAAALAHRPAIVILDDPALGLDPISRKEFNRDLVEHLQATGSTVLYSSHLLDEVEAVADGVAILDQGRIVRTGTTEELRTQVKCVVLPRDAVEKVPKPAALLDVRFDGNQFAVVVDEAPLWIQQLARQRQHHEVIDLSLDEIFEAYVIGRPNRWPTTPALQSLIAA